jgi:sec-independent protein translocase protein TatA
MRPGIWQLIIVLLVIVVVFGGKKIPELARSLGKAKGEFKKGLAEGEKEDDASKSANADAK